MGFHLKFNSHLNFGSHPNFVVQKLELVMELHNNAIAILFGFQRPDFSDDYLLIDFFNFRVCNPDTGIPDKHSRHHWHYIHSEFRFFVQCLKQPRHRSSSYPNSAPIR